MSSGGIVREISADSSVVLRDARCTFVFRRLRTGVLEVRIVGTDHGQFGTATIDEVALALLRERSLELFIDASEGAIPAVSASLAWTRFFELKRESLRRVTILTASKSVALTMAIVRHLSNTGDLIHILSDHEIYGQRKAATVCLP